MRQAATLMALGLMLSSCSSGIDSYEEGMDAQAELMSEMISVLKEVDDESSANKAAEKIEEIGHRMAGIADQMKELPRPNAEEMQEIADKQRAKLRAIQQDVTEQMMKMAQYPVLQDAWMNAMHDIH
jgi:methyl-accepting chemotaxis protein